VSRLLTERAENKDEFHEWLYQERSETKKKNQTEKEYQAAKIVNQLFDSKTGQKLFKPKINSNQL